MFSFTEYQNNTLRRPRKFVFSQPLITYDLFDPNLEPIRDILDEEHKVKFRRNLSPSDFLTNETVYIARRIKKNRPRPVSYVSVQEKKEKFESKTISFKEYVIELDPKNDGKFYEQIKFLIYH